jgi:maltose alpha-D-glucosyltransferase/alpha-amylase
MLRSFAYARQAALQRCSLQPQGDCSKWEPMLEKWEAETRRIFTSVYDSIARPARIYASLEDAQPLLSLFEVEKALYELRYELGNRPDWAGIPLRSLLAFTT